MAIKTGTHVHVIVLTRFLKDGVVMHETDITGDPLDRIQPRLIGRFGRGDWTRQTRTQTITTETTDWE